MTYDFKIKGLRHKDDLWQFTRSRLIFMLWTDDTFYLVGNNVTLYNDTTARLPMCNFNCLFRESYVAVIKMFPFEQSASSLYDLHWQILRRCFEVATVATVQVSSSSENVTVGLLLCKNVSTSNWLHMNTYCK